MYNPPYETNWNHNISYKQVYLTAYDEGYNTAKQRKSIYSDIRLREAHCDVADISDEKPWESYFFYKGYQDYSEFMHNGKAIIVTEEK